MTTSEPKTGGDSDKWSHQADLYHENASTITESHARDLISILKNDILKAKTILEIGCGTGAFSKIYIQKFPDGIPNQELICSDLSSGMLEKAKETTITPPNYQTTIIYKELDGASLQTIDDHSVDIVISLFGIFLIQNQDDVSKAIQRVLKQGTGKVATASWRFGFSHKSPIVGVLLQDAFQIPVQVCNPQFKLEETPFYQWSSEEKIQSIMDDKYQFLTLSGTYNVMHSTVFEFRKLWSMISHNPMAQMEDKSDEIQQAAKQALINFLLQGRHSHDDDNGDSDNKDFSMDDSAPIVLSTASIVAIGRQ
jgi:ubiquinone/menaquinone biosynthesis C-methylase UbiE